LRVGLARTISAPRQFRHNVALFLLRQDGARGLSAAWFASACWNQACSNKGWFVSDWFWLFWRQRSAPRQTVSSYYD
jgi:hypothetical protein